MGPPSPVLSVPEIAELLRDHPNPHDAFSPISSYPGSPPSSAMSPPPASSARERSSRNSSIPSDRTIELPFENYIPFGCLILPGTGCTSLPSPTNGIIWCEVESHTEDSHLLLHRCPQGLRSLLKAHWIRIFSAVLADGRNILRIYILPEDVGQRFVDRNTRALRAALEELISIVDISTAAWNGKPSSRSTQFQPWATGDNSSLYYIFNTLPSPSPSIKAPKRQFNKVAMEEVLENRVPGLNTALYPYQARSAAVMIERETYPSLNLDPRLEHRMGPGGSAYYYSPRDIAFFKEPRMYESIRGGILAETMGLGKTIICLAVILATRQHLPQLPPQFERHIPERQSVPSLMELAVTSAGSRSVPLKSQFSRLRQRYKGGQIELSMCMRAIDDHPIEYLVPYVPIRQNRRTEIPPPRRLKLCSGTIVVVPRNLVHQWRSELRKHVHLRENPEIDDGGLNLLVMDSPKQALPEAKELMKYDIVLFSKTRFEREIMDGSDKYGRTPTNVPAGCHCPYIGATRMRDCTCLRTYDIYSSPLKELHWLRIIIDEGHEFSSSSSNAVLVAEKLVTAERRWIVSGTPAKDRLFGIEVDLAALAEAEGLPGELFDPTASPTNSDSSSSIEPSLVRQVALEKRKRYNRDEEITGAAKSIGIMASNFLKVRPWAEADDDKVEWDDCIYRHESFRGRTYSAFSTCLRRALETLVIKTLPNDVEKDIVLPPLEHNVVYLEPSFYDKLTANLFILFLTANAVTSERTDVDYLFHKNSAKARYQLITNLRQSNFFWTGFNEADVVSAIGHSTRYLEKEGTNCTHEDRHLLQESLKFAQTLLAVNGWKALSKSHEVGLFVDCWPDVSCSWSLNQNTYPHMIGVTQLSQAQTIVNNQLFDANPTEGLEAAGMAAVAASFEAEDVCIEKKSTSRRHESKMGVPSSGLHSEPSAAKRYSLSSPIKVERSPKSRSGSSFSHIQKANSFPSASNTNPITSSMSAPTRPTSHKRKRSLLNRDLPSDSHLALPSIIGTTSAKLSYLIARITTLHTTEKILVFYDGDNTAYYIAQCLELLHIKHLIYAKSLTNELRSKYIVAFDSDISIRVLLMDIRCGALGLNVNKASRVFFVNPVCRPSIEAQAIKRSHRIGQNKPVYVETLILKGTIEEKIFERAKNMTRREHLEASQLSDDQGVTSIIQNARMLPVDLDEGTGERQMAPLNGRLQIFGRNGRGDTKIKGIDLDFDRMEEQEKEAGKDNVEEKAEKKQKKSSSNGSGKRKAKRAEWQIPNYANGVGPTASVLSQEKMDFAVEMPVWKHPIMFGTKPSSMTNSTSKLDKQVSETNGSVNKSIFG